MNPHVSAPVDGDHVLITGFPSFVAARLIRKILDAQDAPTVHLLCRDTFADAARNFVDALPEPGRRRVELVLGNVCDMDLGLAGSEYRALAERITSIYHLAAVAKGSDRSLARRVNVEGTRGILELGGECRRLRRLCHFSTVSVAGRRKGVILEEELDEGQQFRNYCEETRFEAEKLARAAQKTLPVTVFRPSTVVGDSRTGEIDRLEGPYALLALIISSPLDVHLPLPGRGAAPMHLVPVDYVVEAAYALSLDERAAGSTFHLVDPSPLAARKVCELVAERAHKKRPRGFIPTGLARALMHTPGIQRIAQAPLGFLDALDHLVFYNARHTVALLAAAGISCPSFDTYVDHLVRYVHELHVARRQKVEEEESDPFE